MRREFGKTIAELAERDSKVHVIIGDTSYKVFPDLLTKFPLTRNNDGRIDFMKNRIHNFGTAEQSTVAIACGMALEGLIQPWAYFLTPFLVERAFEQIKIGAYLQQPDIKLIGYCDYPDEGPTHALIDEKLPDVFKKNMRVYYPKNSAQTRNAVLESYSHNGPVLISLKKDHEYGSSSKSQNTSETGRVY